MPNPQPSRLPLALLFIFCIICPALGDYPEDRVDISKIPLFPQDYKYPMYSGYLNVTYGDKAFYYILFKSQSQSVTDPVVLWLNGGPGCSSMIGFVSQNGPFMFKPQSTQMIINQYAWNKNAHVIYLQSPSGVGFSKGKSQTYNDTLVGQQNYIALIRFFEKFPQLKTNDFYITGQSYAGIYIPRLAREIIQNNQQEAAEERKINLKGIMIGNGCTHPQECYTARYLSKFQVQFMYSRGYIDSSMYSQYVSACIDSFNERSANCQSNQTKIQTAFYNSKANIYNVYGVCYPVATGSQFFDNYLQKFMQSKPSSQLKHSLRCSDMVGPNKLFNTDEYRPHLHVQSNETLKWTPCSDTMSYTIESRATYYDLPTIVKYGIKIYYYAGDFDAMVPIQGTLFWIKKYRTDFGMTVKKNWRPWSVDNGNTFAGMVWELDGIVFYSVIGAGHMVPTDKPKQAKFIFDRLISTDNVEGQSKKILDIE